MSSSESKPGRLSTRLGRGVWNAYCRTEFKHISDFCSGYGVSTTWMNAMIHGESEPIWMKNLRALKKASGCSWEDILGR